MLALDPAGLAVDGLLVGDVRGPEAAVDADAAADALDGDLEVERAEARDDELARALVEVDREAGIFFGEAVEGGADLVLGALALELDPAREEGRREVGGVVEEGGLLVGEGLAAVGGLELGERDDVARGSLVHGLRLFADEGEDLPEALLVGEAGVEQRRLGLDRAGEDAGERGAARVLIDRGLEDEERCRRGHGGSRSASVFRVAWMPFHAG